MERSFWEQILLPLEWFVEWVLVAFHRGLEIIGMPATSGWTWALSIAGLVVVIRILLIPLFVKQIQSSRRMQLIQPEMQKIQQKYKNKKDPESRQAMSQETMDLYKRTGTNPFSSCLPIIVQMPFFFALFRVLNHLDDVASGRLAPAGPLDQTLASQAENSDLFGAALSSTFMFSGSISAKIVTVVLIILMSATTFMTQHQLMRKNMPTAALEGPFAQQQKIMLYLFPVIFAVSGVNFPIGVLIYWFVTNLWTMCQQFYVIRRMPAPGSAAEKALEERRLRKGKTHKKFSVPGLGGDESAEASSAAGAHVGSASSSLASRAVEGRDTGHIPASGSPAREMRGGGGQRAQPKRNKKRKKR